MTLEMSCEPEGPAVIHVIDDDESVRTALGRLFRSVGLDTIAYPTARDFLEARPVSLPGCIVLDVRLPGTNGLELQARLTDLGISLPVVLMTGHGDVPMTVRAMKAGAVDFLPKPFRDQDMLDAVGQAINRDRAQRSKEGELSVLRQRFATLSPREREVMTRVVAGKLNKQVAGDLGISEVTVKIHRGSVMRKLAVRSLADLVRLVERVNPEPVAKSR